MKSKGRYRRIVVRNGRRYALCGLRVRPVLRRHPEAVTLRWLPAASFVLVLIFSAYLIGRPPPSPLIIGGAVPQVAHFTINDFANASR